MNNNVEVYQVCTNSNCGHTFDLSVMLFKCPDCGASLEYQMTGTYSGPSGDRSDLWAHFDMLPLSDPHHIISLGAGNSEIIHMEELSRELNGAELYLMCDSGKNPTGTFKDREASVIMSRCREIGLDNLVFYSTANTGRSYTHFAAHLGLTTYLFMPSQCAYKNTSFIRRNENNFIIYVDENYSRIAPYTKEFVAVNGLTAIAPMHDRIESYATVAYEQFNKLPDCKYFVQTIASGMGVIGFYKGHRNLLRMGVQSAEAIPKVICVQSEEMNIMSTAYNSGWPTLTDDHLPKVFRENLFEPTLNSTNPVNNYPQLKSTLDENNGIITDVSPKQALSEEPLIIRVLKERNISLRADLEKSLMIGYAGVVKLARQGRFKKGEKILLLSCGRGRDTTTDLLSPDAVIDTRKRDPADLYKQLSTPKEIYTSL
ncbi:pyridoxal-phosphate dependent enzyme [Chitinophaga oryzae]|uniref:Pyridoxal-phosphate dependent enzyme n=1 Tax=Chitinophaga oryzae TaxID=2725414 RepID=A0AAE6ZK30_9BACT|nr:pyridoxal-phosphate dependent enzyme [Chitinophaga oryzae]QJB32839.1 pyridoxal-phosphate dependent enzyme [Chitinophaga oryzae]QJB39292.1 pyridoxal-phosphate dependent enzyme [Chitinophaga oryzae]